MGNPLKVLQESVVQYLEEGIKGAKVPAFHAYIDGSNDDVKAKEIPQLKEDVLKIYKAFVEGMALTKKEVEVKVPVHHSGYSPLFGMPVNKDAREVIASVLNSLMEQCELALLAGCGFGKFSASEEEIGKAQERLRENVETIYLPLPEGAMELKIIAFDSNNDPKHHLLVDGLWEPFRAIGLVKFESTILAFDATMDYGSGNWKLDRLDIEWLHKLAEKSSLFKPAYQKIVGKEFDETEVSKTNPEFIKFLKASPHFQQALNRICSRWTR